MFQKILFFFLLTTHFSQAQSKKILIEYTIQFEGEFLNEEKKKNTNLVEMMDGIEENMRMIKFNLFISDSNSTFYSISEMEKDDETMGASMAKIFTAQDNIYVKDLKNKTLICNQELDGVRYNVDLKNTDNDWKMTSISKKINGYLCYKATLDDPNRRKQIIAWYCPQLPFSAGPIEYGNLPGLILELEIGQLRYLATKITLNHSGEINFKLPKGIKISGSEFSTLTGATMKSIGNN